MNKNHVENVDHALQIVNNVKLIENVLFAVETILYFKVFAWKSAQKVFTFLMGNVLHVCSHVVNVMVVQITNASHAIYLFIIFKIAVFLHALLVISLTYQIETAENAHRTVHYTQILKIVHYVKMALI